MRVFFTFTPGAQTSRPGDDDKAFAGRLAQAAPGSMAPSNPGSACPDKPGAGANDWPLVANGAGAPAPRPSSPSPSQGPLVAAAQPPANPGLRAIFQQAADAALSRVGHGEAFRAPPPAAAFPAAPPATVAPRVPSEPAPRPVDPRPVDTRPVDPRVAIDEAIRAGGGASAQGAFGGPAAPSAAEISPGADALAATAQSIRESMQANIARDAAFLSVSDVMRADLERAAAELAMADARIGAMLDDAAGGAAIDPKERDDMIAKAREQAQQKIRDIAKALDPARDDKPEG